MECPKGAFQATGTAGGYDFCDRLRKEYCMSWGSVLVSFRVLQNVTFPYQMLVFPSIFLRHIMQDM